MQFVTPHQFKEFLKNSGAFESEECCFAQEVALQYGFEFIDDDATLMKCSVADLYALMKALGYSHVVCVLPAPTLIRD